MDFHTLLISWFNQLRQNKSPISFCLHFQSSCSAKINNSLLAPVPYLQHSLIKVLTVVSSWDQKGSLLFFRIFSSYTFVEFVAEVRMCCSGYCQ